MIATIANAASLSDAVKLGTDQLVAIIIPGAWTAADITFQAANDDDGPFYDMYDVAGDEVTVTGPVASAYIKFNPDDFKGVFAFKIRSGLTAAAVAQGAERLIQIVTTRGV